jgi:hypothetical protein
LAVLGVAASIPAMVLAGWVTGFSPLHSPGELALSAIVAMSVGQLWVALLGPRVLGRPSTVARFASTVLTTTAGVVATFALYRAAGPFLQPVWGELPTPSGTLAWAAAILPVAALALLTVMQAVLPVLGHTPAGRAFYVHALHGFYFGAIADRFVDAVWSYFVPRTKEVARA